MRVQSLIASKRDRFVRWKVVAVIIQNEEAESADQAVCRVSRDQVHLAFRQCPIRQPEVHYARGLRESQVIGCRQPSKSVFPLHELRPETSSPLGRARRGVADGLET